MMRQTGIQIGLVLLVTILVGAGCDRHIPSKDPVRSLPDAPPTPTNLTARINDRSINLSWEVADSTEVVRSRIYRADSVGADFIRYDSTTAFSMIVTGLPFDRAVRLRVTTVNSSRIESRPSAEISTMAGLLSIVIDNNDEYTNDQTIYIRINVPGSATYVEFSEDSLFADATIQPFSIGMSFELSQGDGLKMVYARITFADGNQAGEVVSDDIILDTRALIDSVFFSPTGQTFSAGDTISFFVAAHGETGGVARVSFHGAPSILLNDDGTEADVTGGDGIYSALYIVPVALTVANGEVIGTFRDAAGNSAAVARAVEILNIETTTPPASVTLAVGLVDSTTAHLTWTLSEDNDFGSYRIYRSVSPGIDVSYDSLTIAIITEQNTASYDDYLSSAGTYYYRLFVFDIQDSTSASNEVMVIR